MTDLRRDCEGDIEAISMTCMPNNSDTALLTWRWRGRFDKVKLRIHRTLPWLRRGHQGLNGLKWVCGCMLWDSGWNVAVCLAFRLHMRIFSWCDVAERGMRRSPIRDDATAAEEWRESSTGRVGS